MRVAELIAKQLKFLGCKKVFTVTGGASMHLNDAFGDVFGEDVHYLHNEQSCSMAAEAYSRITGIPCVVNVTAGPGSINALNGVFGAYVDSIPMIVISGQAKRETLVKNSGLKGLRQLGDQEVDIVSMGAKICKRIRSIDVAENIKYEVDQAFLIAKSDRPGPVWLDVPIDVQGMKVDEIESGFKVEYLAEGINNVQIKRHDVSEVDLDQIIEKLASSRRPILYVGSGIRIGECYQELLRFLGEWRIPTVTGWNSNDLLWDDHPCYVGRPGTVGNRAGNFAVQQADFLLIVGCRLNIRQVGFNWKSFAKNAWKCHVDIDQDELNKPSLKTDLKIKATSKGFFFSLSKRILNFNHGKSEKYLIRNQNWDKWRCWCKSNLVKFPVGFPRNESEVQGINPYSFIQELTSQLDEGSTTVCGDGTACVVGFQATIIKKGQRIFHNSGCASMGYEIPASIGAHLVSNKEIICLAGDGSMMMNIQELSVIGGKSLPIKIYLLNNQGYHSIRQTQSNYFGRVFGCGNESGLHFPDFRVISEGFGIHYMKTSSRKEMKKAIQESLSYRGPIIHEIVLDKAQEFSPKVSSRKNEDGTMTSSDLDDMYPFLEKEVLECVREEGMSI